MNTKNQGYWKVMDPLVASGVPALHREPWLHKIICNIELRGIQDDILSAVEVPLRKDLGTNKILVTFSIIEKIHVVFVVWHLICMQSNIKLLFVLHKYTLAIQVNNFNQFLLLPKTFTQYCILHILKYRFNITFHNATPTLCSVMQLRIFIVTSKVAGSKSYLD